MIIQFDLLADSAGRKRYVGSVRGGGQMALCHMSGTGLWSTRKRVVPIPRMTMTESTDASGEICAYFDPTLWRTAEDGLIYTDGVWLSEFRGLLIELGFSQSAVSAVRYSEQGMQGDDFVSLDAGLAFWREALDVLQVLQPAPFTNRKTSLW